MGYDFFDIKHTNEQYDLLMKRSLKSAALFYQDRNATKTERAAKINYERFKNAEMMKIEDGLPVQSGGYGYIEGDKGMSGGVSINHDGTISVNHDIINQIITQTDDFVEKRLYETIRNDGSIRIWQMPWRYHHGGMHFVADHEFLLHNGYNGYIKKINEQLVTAVGMDKSFLRGMLYTAEMFREYYLKNSKFQEDKNTVLSKAFAAIANDGCKTFFDAVVLLRCVNILYNSENGRIDKLLYPFYENDSIGYDEAKEYINKLLSIYSKRGWIWHLVIGGCDEFGQPVYNDVTKMVLECAGNYPHPHISLRVNKNMPEKFWSLALSKLAGGSANPALINEDVFINDLHKSYNIPIEDARDFAFGGCSETLIPGKTCVDSTWVAYNVCDVLNDTIFRKLELSESFEEFLSHYKDEIAFTAYEMSEDVNILQHSHAAYVADPICSLHTRGCIEKRKSLWNGGALYNFDNSNIYSTTNVINSLVTIKSIFDGKIDLSKKDLVSAMKTDFSGYENMLLKIENLEKFGNDSKIAQEIASDIVTYIFDEIKKHRCYRGNGYFMPSIIQWITYASHGQEMCATADGRRKGLPLADSGGATAGTALKGPTALISDFAALPQQYAAGTIILNMSLTPECFTDKNYNVTRALFSAFMEMGCGQMQINVIDKSVLEDAYLHPENHKDLIVRVGGFSAYYYSQSREIQKVILDRYKNE